MFDKDNYIKSGIKLSTNVDYVFNSNLPGVVKFKFTNKHLTLASYWQFNPAWGGQGNWLFHQID
jgi:hypothetical protein